MFNKVHGARSRRLVSRETLSRRVGAPRGFQRGIGKSLVARFPALLCREARKIGSGNFDRLARTVEKVRRELRSERPRRCLARVVGSSGEGINFPTASWSTGGQTYDPANRTREFISGGKRRRYARGSEFKSQWSVNINARNNER